MDVDLDASQLLILGVVFLFFLWLHRFATVPVPQYDYEEKSSEFYFTSCLTRPEVIIASCKLRAECDKILKLTLLQTHYTKSLRMDEFEQLQTQASEQAAGHLKERYIYIYELLLVPFDLILMCNRQVMSET